MCLEVGVGPRGPGLPGSFRRWDQSCTEVMRLSSGPVPDFTVFHTGWHVALDPHSLC